MITDNDLNKIKKKLEGVFVTKNEFKESFNALIGEVRTVINMVGDVSQRLDDYHKDHEETLDNHEKRLDRVEDRVCSTN